jgi:Carbohydrate-selective porin, OprB family/S-layer homology domain
MKKIYLLGSTLALSTFATAAFASEPVVSASGQAETATAPYSTFQIVQTDDSAEPQVTSVSQLSDVKPTDWAFQALQSLVERYGCIAGYPNGTFRGNRAATRYELAAALNACLDQISDRFATKEDLETVKALQEEFKTELATLKGRVDGLEARTATLEAQQFSTTTKLVGEAIFQVSASSDTTPVPGGGIAGPVLAQFFGRTGDNAVFNNRATLSLLTSFTGKDLLITSLQQGSYEPLGLNGFGQLDAAGNPSAPFKSSQGGLAPAYNQAETNQFGLYYLGYRFPIFKDKGTVFVTMTGGELSDFTDTLNPAFDSDGQGALSGFGIRNPIYRHISGRVGSFTSGTGAGANFNVTDQFNIAVGYLAPNIFAGQSAGDPTNAFGAENGGLFGGDYSALVQLTYKPTKTLGFGLTYVRSYQNSFFTQLGGGSGTFRASVPFLNTPTAADSAGLEFSWQPSPRFAISAWAGATFATAQSSNGIIVADGDKATILNGAVALSFPDLLAPGNMGGIILGVEPQVTSNTSFIGTDPNTNFHVEGLYRVKVNDNISITPGVIAIINPEANSSNDPIIIGTLRTTFSF